MKITVNCATKEVLVEALTPEDLAALEAQRLVCDAETIVLALRELTRASARTAMNESAAVLDQVDPSDTLGLRNAYVQAKASIVALNNAAGVPQVAKDAVKDLGIVVEKLMIAANRAIS